MSIKSIIAGLTVIGILVGGLFLSNEFSPRTASVSAVQTGSNSMVISMHEPYLPNDEFSDDYRCFIFDPQLEEDAIVTGFKVNPDQENLVHHVVVFVSSSAIMSQAEAEDRREEGPGWTCFGGPVQGASGDIGNALGTWAPGADNIYPEGTAKTLRAGTKLIVQIHYSLLGTGEILPDSSSLELFTTQDETLRPLLGFTIASPVEIKCPGEYPEDPQDPCHREYAINHVVNPITNGSLHADCQTNLGYYLARDVGDGSAQDVSCEVRVPREAELLGAWGHMHLRGTSLKVVINEGTDEEQLLLYIPRWNFNNQEMYWLDQPIYVNASDKLRITCTYDNSSAIPAPDGSLIEPRYIVWGEGTTDEMCLALLQYTRP